MKHILVTGGAGYIGSFMTKRLLDEGFSVTVIDSLDRGNKEFVDQRANLQVGNILDKQFLNTVFQQEPIDAVLHFAGYISVGESMSHPDEYFRNNTLGTLCLLDQMRVSDVKRFIFSSTAGVYGNPQIVPIPEDHPKHPENPYGESKLLVEHGLSWYQSVFGLNYVVLRYFNAAGAALDGSMGELHPSETHIIPNVISAVRTGKPFHLFGDDYDTTDGTCVRDYVHIIDLIEAHMLALRKIEKDSTPGLVYNVGTGKGFTNKELIAEVEKVSGMEVQVVIEQRRPGDAAILVADNSKIKAELNFEPKYSDLESIVTSAWKWHTK